MEKKLRIKELIIDDETGVEAIALVEMPAIEVDFLKFNKDKENITFATADTEKHIITGPAMIPDKMIYRFDAATNEEYYVYFTKETVEKISQRYLIEHKQSNVNLEHADPITDVSLVESWIVTDPENDKASALGYSVPVGTWMVSMKVNNEDVWNNLVKTGTVKGFSIEGYFVQKFGKQIDPDDTVLQQIIDILNNIDPE